MKHAIPFFVALGVVVGIIFYFYRTTIYRPSSIKAVDSIELPKETVDAMNQGSDGTNGVFATSPDKKYSLLILPSSEQSDDTLFLRLTNLKKNTTEKIALSGLARPIKSSLGGNSYTFHWINNSVVLLNYAYLYYDNKSYYDDKNQSPTYHYTFNVETRALKRLDFIYYGAKYRIFTGTDDIAVGTSIYNVKNEQLTPIAALHSLVGDQYADFDLSRLSHDRNFFLTWRYEKFQLKDVVLIDTRTGEEKILYTNNTKTKILIPFVSWSEDDRYVNFLNFVYDTKLKKVIDIGSIFKEIDGSATQWYDNNTLFLYSRIDKNWYLLDITTLTYKKVITR